MPASSDAVVVRLPADVDLHARPAATVVRLAMGLDATVTLAAGGREAVAKSLLAVLALGAKAGTEITVAAEGPEAEAARDAVAACLTDLHD